MLQQYWFPCLPEFRNSCEALDRVYPCDSQHFGLNENDWVRGWALTGLERSIFSRVGTGPSIMDEYWFFFKSRDQLSSPSGDCYTFGSYTFTTTLEGQFSLVRFAFWPVLYNLVACAFREETVCVCIYSGILCRHQSFQLGIVYDRASPSVVWPKIFWLVGYPPLKFVVN